MDGRWKVEDKSYRQQRYRYVLSLLPIVQVRCATGQLDDALADAGGLAAARRQRHAVQPVAGDRV